MLTTQLISGTIAILVCVIFHAAGLLALAKVLSQIDGQEDAERSMFLTGVIFTVAVVGIIGIHTVEAWAWAAVYLSLGEFTNLQQALYFSVVTSTTLGYGDLTLSETWQLLASFEAMGGLILFGASTAFLLGLMRSLFEMFDSPRPPTT